MLNELTFNSYRKLINVHFFPQEVSDPSNSLDKMPFKYALNSMNRRCVLALNTSEKSIYVKTRYAVTKQINVLTYSEEVTEILKLHQ